MSDTGPEEGHAALSRTPPVDVRRQLRREVGFGCPVPDCRSPWLEYHHFDPEWSVRPHHNVTGMIPLCPTHHGQAAAWTAEQLRAFKAAAAASTDAVAGRFEWLRRDLLGIVGGGIFHETPILVQFQDQPMIWFERDDDGYLRLNLRMLTIAGAGIPRVRIENNDFFVGGNPLDLDCPPSGRRIAARYENGDALNIEFRDVPTLDAAVSRWPHAESGFHFIPQVWPMTAVEVSMDVGQTNVRFGPNHTTFGTWFSRGHAISHCGVGFAFG